MAHSNLLHPVVTTVDRQLPQRNKLLWIPQTENSSVSKADEINSLSFVRKNHKDQGISSKAAVSSLRLGDLVRKNNIQFT